MAIKSGKVRAPTHIISTISDDRGIVGFAYFLSNGFFPTLPPGGSIVLPLNLPRDSNNPPVNGENAQPNKKASRVSDR